LDCEQVAKKDCLPPVHYSESIRGGKASMSNSGKISLTTYFDGYALGKAQKHFLWIASISYAFDMIDTTLFAMVSPILMINYGLTMEKISQLNALLFVGMFVGGIFCGWLSDHIGRKKGLMINIAIFSIASLMNAVWQPQYFLLLELSRFLTGFGILGMSSTAMTYISEMMPSESRGKYQSFTIAAGTVIIPFVTILASQIADISFNAWRFLLVFGGLGILLLPIGSKWLVESPRWLVSKGRVEEAENVMEKVLNIKVDLSEAALACQRISSGQESLSLFQVIKIMFSKSMIKQTCCVIVVCWGIVIANGFMSNWYTVALTNMGFVLSAVLLCQAATSFAQPLGDFLSGFVSDHGGRRIPILVFCFGSGVAVIILGLMKSLIPIGVFMFCKTFLSAGCTAIMWTYLAESFPTKIRSSASGLIFSSGRLVIAASNLAVPALYASYGWFGLNFVNGIFYIVPAIIAMAFGKATAQKSLEEINENC